MLSISSLMQGIDYIDKIEEENFQCQLDSHLEGPLEVENKKK